MTEFVEVKKGEQKIYMGNRTHLDVVGVGTYKLNLKDNLLVLKDVLFVPGIRRDLISVPALSKKGLVVHFYDNKFSISKDNEIFATGYYEPEHGLFKLPIMAETENN